MGRYEEVTRLLEGLVACDLGHEPESRRDGEGGARNEEAKEGARDGGEGVEEVGVPAWRDGTGTLGGCRGWGRGDGGQ